MSARDELLDEYGRADTAPLGTLADLRTKLDGIRTEVLHETPLFLAEYDGVESEVHLTLDDARAMCDDVAGVDARGRGWDWSRNEHGIHVQFWTHEDDDRPLHTTGGTVTEVTVQRPEVERAAAPAVPVPDATGGEGPALPSRFHATPVEVDDYLRRILCEDTLLNYQWVIGDKAVEEAAKDVRGAIAVRSLDPTRRSLSAKEAADHVDPAKGGGHYPSVLLCGKHDGFGPCPGAPRCTPRDDDPKAGAS